MRRILLGKYIPSEFKKTHYKQLYIWLKSNPEIEFRKLQPYGFSVNTSTIPVNLIDEWIRVCTFYGKE